MFVIVSFEDETELFDVHLDQITNILESSLLLIVLIN